MSPDILKEHRYIRIVTDRLRAMLAAPNNALPPARWHAVLDHEMRALSATLKRHFDHEENGGYMKDVIARRPGTSTKFQALFAQHASMRAQLTDLIEANEAGTGIDELRPQLRKLLAALASHEQAETDLVQDAIQHDIGGGD